MRVKAHYLAPLLCCFVLLAFLDPAPAPARAEIPPLLVFASVSRGDVERGDTFTLTLSIYSTSTEPETPTLRLLPAAGLIQADAPRWSTGHVWQDHPATVLVSYVVADDAPAGGAYLPIDAIVRDTDGNEATASVSVRVGTFVWPPPRRMIFLPMVEK